MENIESKYRVNSVHKAFQIIECLSKESPRGMTQTELQKVTRLKKATLFVLIATLLENKVVRYDEGTKQYRLGFRLTSWAGAVDAGNDLKQTGYKYLEKLTTLTLETSHLAVLDGNEIIFIDKVESSEPLKMSSKVGSRHSLDAPATAKAIFAFLEPKIQEKLLASMKFEKLTSNTVTGKEQYLQRTAEAIHLGYAIDDEEILPGTRCVAAPVFNGNGKVCAAIGITAPAIRLTRERVSEVGEIIKKVARGLSEELGFVTAIEQVA